jgi:small conductance mechanosensitive channel
MSGHLYLDRFILLVIAVAIFFGGRFLAAQAKKLAVQSMEKREVDPALRTFGADLLYYALIVLVVIIALSVAGIPTASFVAVVGAATLAIGFALQGSLANFAAGVLIILFRQFKVGDFIEGGGVLGTVEKISILNTELKSIDGRQITVPNGKLMGDVITNFSVNPTRRVDLVFGISYNDDIDKAKGIIERILKEDPRVLEDPAPLVAVVELGDSSVDIAARPWVNRTDFLGVMTDTTEKVKKAFDAEGISIPFPQRDIHLFRDEKSA